MEPTSITSHFDFESRALKSLSTFDVLLSYRTSPSFQLHGECGDTQRLFTIVNRNAWREFSSISTGYGSTNESIREFNIIHSVNYVRSHLYVPTYGHKLHKT
jgi:hypothetical protein